MPVQPLPVRALVMTGLASCILLVVVFFLFSLNTEVTIVKHHQ